MKKLDNKAFTLIELIVVITIIGITASIATLSVNSVFDWNTKASAQQFMDSVRGIRNNSMTSTKKWAMKVGFDSEQNRFYYEVSSSEGYREKTIVKKDVQIIKDGNLVNEETIIFESSAGKADSGWGSYLFKNSATGKQQTIRIIKETGSVVKDD